MRGHCARCTFACATAALPVFAQDLVALLVADAARAKVGIV